MIFFKGFTKDDAKEMTDILERNEEAFLYVMMAEELGIPEDSASPIKNGIVTFISFCIFGSIPLISFVVG